MISSSDAGSKQDHCGQIPHQKNYLSGILKPLQCGMTWFGKFIPANLFLGLCFVNFFDEKIKLMLDMLVLL